MRTQAGRIRDLERKVRYLEGVAEVLADQTNQVAGLLVQLQSDATNLAKVVLGLAQIQADDTDGEDA